MEYKIIRSRRKTLSLSVTREGEVVVRAPLNTERAYIEHFVEKNRAWIEKRQKAAFQRPRLVLENGTAIRLFGSSYLLKTGRSRISGGVLFLPEEGREEAFARLLKKFSLEVMQYVTSRIAARYGFSYRSVRISSARGRWGSCNRDGVIAFTFRIAFLEPSLCEYVAVHELAHTVVFNHSAEFWEVVESILPDWKVRRKALKSSSAMSFL